MNKHKYYKINKYMESFKIIYSFDIAYHCPPFSIVSSSSTIDAKHIYTHANRSLNWNMFVKSSSFFNGWSAYRSMKECTKMLVPLYWCSFSHKSLKQNHYMSLIVLNLNPLISYPYIPHYHVHPLLAPLQCVDNNKLYYLDPFKWYSIMCNPYLET